MEHRWGERLLVDIPVRVHAHAFAARDGRLTDLSVSGAHLRADVEARLLSRIEVAIVLPQRAKHDAPAVSGYVARKYRDGYGIEWCEFSPPAIGELLRMAVKHPYAYLRLPVSHASLTRSRISGSSPRHGSLLKHG